MTNTQININSADFRLTTRPPALRCEQCHVNAATYRKFDSATNTSKNLCAECAKKAK